MNELTMITSPQHHHNDAIHWNY